MEERIRISNIYIITLIVAACSIVYELLAAQTLAMFAANTVKWYSLTIGVFLVALGIGALNADRLFKRWGVWNSLFYVEIALSVAGALAVVLIYVGHILHMFLYAHDYLLEAQILFFSTAFTVIFLVGILTGFELPLLIKAGNALTSCGKVTNRVLGADYLGSLLGAVSFPLLLLPNLELITIGFLMAAINASVAIWLIFKFRNNIGVVMPKALFVAWFALTLGIAAIYLPEFQQYFLKKFYYSKDATRSWSTLFSPMDGFPPILRVSSPYQKIDIVEDVHLNTGDILINAYSTKFIEQPGYPRSLRLYLNRDFQFSSRYDEFYHEYFAHVPIIQNNEIPEEILVLGAGDGLLIRELLKYEQVRSIVHVDLDRELVRLASSHVELKRMNANALSDPRVTTIVGDGYQYLRQLDRKYPAIFIDFPYAADYNLAKLYSVEFFYFVRKHLTEGGIAVFDATTIDAFSPPDTSGMRRMLAYNDWPIYYNTLKKAGFETIIPYVSSLGFRDLAGREVLERRSPLPPVDEWAASEYASMFPTREAHAKERERRMLKYLVRHTINLEQGFIMMVNGPTKSQNTFRDFGIKHHVLNRERYRMAFEFPFDQPASLDLSKVNSIMRPILPTLDIWHIRRVR